jgi:hypothetical protein
MEARTEADPVPIDTGANASAEEAEEGVEDGAQQVNNVVNSFRLHSTSFDKKSYLSHLKSKSRAPAPLRVSMLIRPQPT